MKLSILAVPLLLGRLTAEDYEDEVARDPRIDALRDKMVVTENVEFSRDYLDADKRAIGNAVQVWFAGGERQRSYLILHRPPKANKSARRPGSWWARSFAGASGLDLRKPADVAKVERLLLSLDLTAPGK